MIAARPVVVTLSPGSDHQVVLQKQTVTGRHVFHFSVVPGVYYVRSDQAGTTPVYVSVDQDGGNTSLLPDCR